MLLKYNQYQKRSRLLSNGPQRTTAMKMLNGKGKSLRRSVKMAASKRLAPSQRLSDGKKDEDERRLPLALTMGMGIPVEACDNSNDSGLGFDQIDYSNSRTSCLDQEYCWTGENVPKKRRYEFKHESDNANDNFTFIPRVAQRQPGGEMPLCLRQEKTGETGLSHETALPPPMRSGGKMARVAAVSGPQQGVARNGKVHLEILSQPEMQHRARYQTEGSRGAVKDRTGNSFPIVKLSGYNKPATLEVYIGTDQGRVAPHMFYQACRVSGKNSTPCVEKKVEGTVLIEIEMDPTKDMTVTCDCVGILKERNVDVEHRFPEESSGRSKKKSTRCRMVFRTTITHDDGTVETLQVTSQPIICTQPPGVPEICKKSLVACPASGGLELFILGKNFLKDTRVSFSHGEPGSDLFWESVVQPDKEFLQQSHLVCTIPPYRDEGIREMVTVRLIVTSSGRSSEPHTFTYTPVNALPLDPIAASRASAQNMISSPVFAPQNVLVGVQWHVPIPTTPTFIQDEAAKNEKKDESEMMPPPLTDAVPTARRSSPVVAPTEVKREAESPPCLAAALREFITPDAPLPSLQVENYLSRIESPPGGEVSAQCQGEGVGEVKADLLSLPLPLPLQQINLAASQPPQPQLSIPISTPSQVIMGTKLAGLLGGGSEDMLQPGELLYPPAAVQPEVGVAGPSVTVPPVLLDSSTEEVVGAGTATGPEAGSYGVLASHRSPPQLAYPSTGEFGAPLPQYLAPRGQTEAGAKSLLLSAPPAPPTAPAPQHLPKPAPLQKKCEEGIPLPQELTTMSENDLISYINPSCFDQGNQSTFSQFFI